MNLTARQARSARQAGSLRPSLCLAATGGLCLLLLALHLGTGAGHPLRALAAMVLHPERATLDRRILLALQMPRALGVALAGASLGAAGYLLQVALRNRLAEPQLLALNAGASLTMVLLTAFPALAPAGVARALAASLGAGVMFGLVLLVASAGRSGPQPAKLLFCGIAFSALAHSVTSVILILDSETLEELRFWLIGDGAAARADLVRAALPLQLAGLGMGMAAMPALAVMGLGESVAKGLGVRTGGARLAALVAAACLTGGSVSVVGPIGFVGLIAPMLWPGLQGRPTIAALLLTALSGACILLMADIAASHLLYPRELPTGAVTGLVGAAAFLILFRRGRA